MDERSIAKLSMLYNGKYLPFLYLRTQLKGKFKSGQIFLIIKHEQTTTTFLSNLRLGKIVCICRKVRKKHAGKNNFVYSVQCSCNIVALPSFTF